jgi:hypothetical protein
VKRLSIALLLAVLTTSSLYAQDAERCKNTESVADCFVRVANGIDATVKEEIIEDENKKANTGVPTLTSPLGSAVKDFLALFAASADSSFLSRGNDGSMTFDLNLGAEKFMTGRPLKVQTVFHTPQLDPKVKAGLTGDVLQKTEQSLDEFDDLSFSLTYAPQNRSLGRTLSAHRPLFQVLLGPVPTDQSAPALLAVLQSVSPRFKDAQGNPLPEPPPFGDMGADRAEVEQAVIAAARAEAALDARDVAAMDTGDVADFQKLLVQQPQAYASVVQRSRSEFIGPDQLSFKLTYETSGRSLRTFYSEAAKKGCGERELEAARNDREGQQADVCRDAWEAFVDEEKTQAALRGSGRFAFSVEYAGADANAVEIPLPAPAAPFKLSTEDTESLVGSVTYGQVLMRAAEGTREGRIDLKASYENVTGDEDRDNRFVVSAVYSQKLSDTMTIPFGIVYANHDQDPAFKDVDRKFSMHFGLVFKMPDIPKILGGGVR